MISIRGKWTALLFAILILAALVCTEAAVTGSRTKGQSETPFGNGEADYGIFDKTASPGTIGGVANGMSDDSVKLFLEGYFGADFSEYVSFPDFESAKKALDCGRVSAIWAPDVTADYLVRTGKYRSLAPAETPGKGTDRFEFAFAFAPESEALKSSVNAFLKELRQMGLPEPESLSGTVWSVSKAALSESPETSKKAGNRKLYVGVTGAVPPLAFYQNGKACGSAVEIAKAYAESTGRKAVFVPLDEKSAYVALMAGRVDMLAVGATSENHSLTMPKYRTSSGYLGVKEYRLIMGKEGSKVSGFMNVIKDNLISGGAYRQILSAAVTTVLVTLLSFLVAVLVWFGLSALGKSEKKPLCKTAAGFAYLFRSIPVPLLLLLLGGVVLAGLHIPLLIPAAIGIGLNGAGLLMELSAGNRALATGEEQTSKENLTSGEEEKRNSVNSRLRFLGSRPVRRIAVTIVQWTSVAGCIGIKDLAEVFQTIGNRTMYPLFSIACCILCYLVAIVVLETLPYTGEAKEI